MNNEITVQGKSVENAIEKALKILKTTRDEVEVEILSNPSKNILGFRKGLAEVKVTRKQIIPHHSNEVDTTVDQNDEQLENDCSGKPGARVKEGQLEFCFDEQSRPSIMATEDVMLYINGEIVTGKAEVEEGDDVTFAISDEVTPPKYSIQLIDGNMSALLKLTPGQRIEKKLADTKMSMDLVLSIEENISVFNDLKPQQIVDELKRLGVQQGIIFPAIQEVVQSEEPLELVVARGTPPEEGRNGDLDVYIETETFDPDSLDKIDFREMNKVSTVKEGDAIATHIAPVEGKDGLDLLGKVKVAKQVQNIILRLGRNVEMIDGVIVAKIGGNPVIDRRGKAVSIEVNPELYHPGEVSIDSGNIRTEGDVRIGGDVRTSMFVGASGTVRIGGAVRKATIEAMQSAYILGNVLSSDITVGKRDNIEQKLVEMLEEIVVVIMQVHEAVQQIAVTRGNVGQLPSGALKQLIHLLLEKKHLNFKKLTSEFVYSVNEEKSKLDGEWGEIADELYLIFLTPLSEALPAETDLQVLIEKLETIIETYEVDISITNELILPYVANSRLYSNGNIEVNGKGSIQSSLVAGNDITINGVCRGGEIIAQNNIVLKESGSENPVTTIVRTGEKGRIKIGKVYIGTEIQIGNRKYAFERDDYEINARIDSDGRLILR